MEKLKSLYIAAEIVGGLSYDNASIKNSLETTLSNMNIPYLDNPYEPHTTIIYSNTDPLGDVDVPEEIEFDFEVTSLDIFNWSEDEEYNRCVVVRGISNTLEKLHYSFKDKYSLETTYSNYHPHITLLLFKEEDTDKVKTIIDRINRVIKTIKTENNTVKGKIIVENEFLSE